jgi:hypothetical protein
MLATSPAVLLVVDVILTSALGPDAGFITGAFAGLVYFLLALSADSSRLRKAGVRVPIWMGIVLPPLYLFKRAKATGRPQAAFITILVCYVLAFGAALSGASNLDSNLPSSSYQAGQQAGSQAAQDRFNDLFATIEDSCAAKSDYFAWTDYSEFIQGCVDEYNAESGN